MIETLSAPEVRVLGALIEKALTTPDYYPLTLNSLTAACNQKSNRNPVVSYGRKEVAQSLGELKKQFLVTRIISDDARVPKYRHNFPVVLHLNPPQTAVMAVLMLRGPQTVGEIRGRSERLFSFSSLDEVVAVLGELSAMEEGTLVKELPRQPGFKESRYAHLLSGEPREEIAPSPYAESRLEPETIEVHKDRERMEALEAEVKSLREDLKDLSEQFAEFKKQFE